MSVNTVFNDSKTKEDLFFDRQDAAVESLGRVVGGARVSRRSRALRRDFHEALDERDWRYGFTPAPTEFYQMVIDSPALTAADAPAWASCGGNLAEVLADETDADPDDPTPACRHAARRAGARRLGEYLRRLRAARATRRSSVRAGRRGPGLRLVSPARRLRGQETVLSGPR